MSRTFTFTILCFYFCFYFYFLHSVNLEFSPFIFSTIAVLNCKIIVSLSILFQSIQHLSSMIKDFHLLKFQIPSKTQWFERNISTLFTPRTMEWFLPHSLIVFFWNILGAKSVICTATSSWFITRLYNIKVKYNWRKWEKSMKFQCSFSVLLTLLHTIIIEVKKTL